jgi:hypothetical protein
MPCCAKSKVRSGDGMSWLLAYVVLACGTGRDQYDSDSLAVNRNPE